jgi:transposase
MLEIDNSAAERALRAVALGRKNFLFVGSDCGGERAAAMYSLIGSAKLNALDPELYLRTVLTRIADHPVSRIDELLPWNLAASLQSHSSQAA